jgi:hypothetical protein
VLTTRKTKLKLLTLGRDTDMANLFNASEVYEALTVQGLLPEWSKLGTQGEYDPTANRMITPKNRQGTVAHELTHAAQYNLLFPVAQLLSQKSKGSLTKQEKQFLDAMSKIMLVGNYKSEDIGKTYKLNELYYRGKSDSEKRSTDYNDYRTSLTERQAFGVGNMTKPADAVDVGGLHFDPTMATEFSILMGLYDSLPATVKNQASQLRQQTVQQTRKNTPNKFTQYPFTETTDLFDDPFAPTIK